jgi:hypothetical protein
MHKNHQILEILKKFSLNHQFEAKITRSDEISPDLATLHPMLFLWTCHFVWLLVILWFDL